MIRAVTKLKRQYFMHGRQDMEEVGVGFSLVLAKYKS